METFNLKKVKPQNRTGNIIAKTYNIKEANKTLGYNFINIQNTEIEENSEALYLLKFNNLSYTSSLWVPVYYFYVSSVTRSILTTYSTTQQMEYKGVSLTPPFNKDRLKIDTILSHNKTLKGIAYKIKWRDCSIEDSTWESDVDMKHLKKHKSYLTIYNNYKYYTNNNTKIKDNNKKNDTIENNDSNQIQGLLKLINSSIYCKDFDLTLNEIYLLIKRLSYSKLSYNTILLADFPYNIKRLLTSFILYTDHTPKIQTLYNKNNKNNNNNSKERYNTFLQYNIIFSDLININKWRKQLNKLSIRNISITSTTNKLGLNDELKRIIKFNQTSSRYIETIIINSSLIKQKNNKQILTTMGDLNLGILVYDTFNSILIQPIRQLQCNLHLFLYNNITINNSKHCSEEYLRQYIKEQKLGEWGNAGKEGLIDFETNKHNNVLKVTYTTTLNKDIIATPDVYKIMLDKNKSLLQLFKSKFAQKKCLFVYYDTDLKYKFIGNLKDNQTKIKEVVSFNKIGCINTIKECIEDNNTVLLIRSDNINHSTSSLILSRFEAIILIHSIENSKLASLSIPILSKTIIYIPCYPDRNKNSLLNNEQSINRNSNNSDTMFVLYKQGLNLNISEESNNLYQINNSSNTIHNKLFNFEMSEDRFVGFLDINFKNTNLNPFNIRRKLYTLLTYYAEHRDEEFISFIERDRNDMLKILRRMDVSKKVFDIFTRMQSGRDTRSYYEYYFIYHNLAFIVLLYNYYDIN